MINNQIIKSGQLYLRNYSLIKTLLLPKDYKEQIEALNVAV